MEKLNGYFWFEHLQKRPGLDEHVPAEALPSEVQKEVESRLKSVMEREPSKEISVHVARVL